MNKTLSLLFIFLAFSCFRKNNTSATESIESLAIGTEVQIVSNSDDSMAIDVNKVIEVDQVKVYIENTKSMYGYLPPYGRNGGVSTDFRNAVSELLRVSKLNYQEENVELNLINNSVSKTINAKDNLDKIDVNTLKRFHSQGNQDSDFDKLFKDVLKDWDEKELIVIVADFIYSPKGRDPVTGLDNYRGEITQAFFNNTENTLPTVNILHLRSDFHGNYYYDNENKAHSIKNRPYYIFIIGNENSVKEYSNLVLPRLRSYDFKNQYTLSPSTKQINNYSALPYTLNIGRFQPKFSTSGYTPVQDVTLKNTLNSESHVQLAVAAKLEGIPVTDDYLMNTNNYSLSNNRVQLTDIRLISDNKIKSSDGSEEVIKTHDIQNANGATHVFLFSFPSTYKGKIKLSLNKKIPDWVKQVTIVDDDLDIDTNVLKQSQTFGFSYIVQGIFDAHTNSNSQKEHFNITVNVDQEITSTGMGSFLGWVIAILILGAIISIIVKNKQRK